MATNDEFADLEPLPQDDGPDAVVRIRYSQNFRETMDRFRAILVREEVGERALRLTEHVVNLNAANYTAWAHRRRCLEALASDELWERELEWSAEMAVDNPKNYQVWFHRRRVVERARPDVGAELAFVAEALEEDAKNYHAWGYRQWLLRTLGGWEHELSYCAKLLDDDCFNNSAWNQRMFVLQETGALKDPGAVRTELSFARKHLEAGADNAAPWNYALGLVEASDCAEDAAWLAEACRVVLASAPACVPAAATLVDMYAASGSDSLVEEAAALCRSLATQWDQIRSKYWALREAELRGGGGVGAQPSTTPSA